MTKSKLSKASSLFLALALVLSVVIFAGPMVSASPGATIYVPDDHTTIQAAVTAADAGDTIIVRDGTYTENVDVNKQLTIQSENGAESTTVQAANLGDHVFQVTADNVTITGFTVTGASTNYSAGIYLGISFGSGVDYCTMSNNTVSNNYCGIRLQDSSNNTITNNIASGNSEYGIMLANSANSNTITNNTTSDNNNGSGIYLFGGASNNTISDNTCSGQWRGIYLFTGSTSIVSNNIVFSNTITNNNYGIDVYASTDNTVYLNNLSNSWANVQSQEGATNTWSSPTMRSYTYDGTTYENYLGNSWSDYGGSDADGDGIGDTPYSIEDDNDDSYPLIELFENYEIIDNDPPDAPSNVLPTDAAANVSLTATLQSSAFSDPDAGDTHAASQWQIREAIGDYSSPVFNSGEDDSSNLTQITIPSGNLSINTQYYWRVRHQDNHGAWSDWSSETSFTTTPEEVVTFPDSNLEAAIREAIGKPEGAIYPADLEGLTSLDASERGIADLTGLEHCTSLTHLHLSRNQIGDVSPISNLTGLTELDLDGNYISNINPLSNLTGLTELDLQGNQISDVSPISNLTSLTWMHLGENQVSDISPLSNLTSLTVLWLRENQISDISPLENLTSLTYLNVEDNLVIDITPLANLTSVTNFHLGHNQISNISPLANLTSLTVLELHVNQISDISFLSGLTSLTYLTLNGNQITNISPLENLTSVTRLHLQYNQISNIEPLVNNLGLAEGDTVDLTNNPLNTASVNVYIPQLVARGVEVLLDEVTFPDSNLEAAIREAIGKHEGAIYPADLEGLTSLDASGRGITDLTGLEYCTSLTWLDLHENQIGNITPLSNLASLTWLGLGGNQISDITPLSNLTSLIVLGLGGNQISDISPLSNLTSLTRLWLWDNQISDISPLSNLTSLEVLWLWDNQISDISPLENLTNLGVEWAEIDLNLSGNEISDIEALVNNPGLSEGDTIDLRDNPLSTTSVNIYVPQLEERGVEVLSDIAPEALAADFSASPTSGTAPLTVRFTDQSTGGITDWEWDFDSDGRVDSTEQNPSHTYEFAGNYTVSLRVAGPGGEDIRVKSEIIMVKEKAEPKNGGGFDCVCSRVQAKTSPGELLIGWATVGLCWGTGYYLVRRRGRGNRK